MSRELESRPAASTAWLPIEGVKIVYCLVPGYKPSVWLEDVTPIEMLLLALVT